MCKLSASLICANPLSLETDIKECVEGGIDQFHFDVMDGLFVPRYGLYPEILKHVKNKVQVPVDVHMMTQDSEKYVELFAQNGADYFTFHIETTAHPTRLINKIKKNNMIPGIALNPYTPCSLVENIIGEIDYICIMMIDPGVLNSKIYDFVYKKIENIKTLFTTQGIENYTIQIDGGVNIQTVERLCRAGATNLVCGTSTIFNQEKETISYKIQSLRKVIAQYI